MSVVDAIPPGYLPMRVKLAGAGPIVVWCSDDGRAFDDPFFDETIQQCMRRPFNRAFMPHTPIESLLDFARSRDCRPPDAFIFHMSRCGSTLLAQMFTALADTRVISESPAIDQVLYADRRVPGLSAQTHIDWLRAIVLSHGANAQSPFARHVVKLDAWHIERLPLIERAFPEVPWVFLFRHPLEVLVSNLALRAMSTIPGVASHGVPGVDLIAALNMPSEQYLALILQHNMQTALRFRSRPRGLYVNYADLPDAALPAILEHFGMSLSPSEINRMLAKAARNAKQPTTAFIPDARQKQETASTDARQLSADLLMPSFEELQSVCWRSP